MIVNMIDLLRHPGFDVARCINPDIELLGISPKPGEDDRYDCMRRRPGAVQ